MKTTLIGEVFVEKQGFIHIGSEFSRHPEGLRFLGLRSEFSRSEFSSHPSEDIRRWSEDFQVDLMTSEDIPNSTEDFRRFPKLTRRYLKKIAEDDSNIAEDDSKILEEFQRSPEDFRRFPMITTDLQAMHGQLRKSSDHLRISSVVFGTSSEVFGSSSDIKVFSVYNFGLRYMKWLQLFRTLNRWIFLSF